MSSNEKLQALLSSEDPKSAKGKMLRLAVDLLRANLQPDPPLVAVLPWLYVLAVGDIVLLDGTAYGEDAIRLGTPFVTPLFACLFPHLSDDPLWWKFQLYSENGERNDAAIALAQTLAKDTARFRSVSYSPD